jgi:hypothetical protein
LFVCDGFAREALDSERRRCSRHVNPQAAQGLTNYADGLFA